MSNELMTLEPIQIDFKPSIITIRNESELSELVSKTAEHYASLTFDAKNIQGAKDARKELNNIVEILEGERKKIKGEYTQPLDEFENKIKEYVTKIKEAKSPIDENIKNYEENERSSRFEKVQEKVNEIASMYDVDPSEIDIPNQWTNASALTQKGAVTKGVTDKITDAVKEIATERDRLEGEKRIIEGYARALKLDADAWVRWVESGKSAAEVMREIDAVMANKAEEVVSAPPANVDVETGEIFDEPTEEVVGDKETFTFRVTGTYDQLSALNQSLVSLGIEYELVEE